MTGLVKRYRLWQNSAFEWNAPICAFESSFGFVARTLNFIVVPLEIVH